MKCYVGNTFETFSEIMARHRRNYNKFLSVDTSKTHCARSMCLLINTAIVMDIWGLRLRKVDSSYANAITVQGVFSLVGTGET